MRVTEELLCQDIGRNVLNMLDMCRENFVEDADSKAIEIIEKVQAVLFQHEELSDFEIVDKIVDIFGKYNINTGGCHDFG